MNDKQQRLNDLLRQQGVMRGSEWLKRRETSSESVNNAQATPDPRAPTQEESIAARLAALSRRLGMPAVGPPGAASELEQPPFETVVPGEVVSSDAGSFYLVRRDYAFDHPQGCIHLGAALESASRHIAFSACDPALEDFDPRTAVFVDTETTGLAGGAGTVAFLVGLGYFTERGFRLDQCFMRDFDEEEPLLLFLSEILATRETMVSYNGKSFDLPLLRTRFIQNRIPCRLDAMMHFDLVHVARRFFKRRLRDCSLGNIEREVLGLYREGDVPGYLIPQMWYDFIQRGITQPLDGVFYHHRMDILSLAALTGWLCQCLEGPHGQTFDFAEDCLSVVRLHFKQKQWEQAVQHAEGFLSSQPHSPLRRECLELLSTAYKRLNLWEEMEQALLLMTEEFPRELFARLELAKHHEHRTRNLFHARDLIAQAIDYLEDEQRHGMLEPELRVEILPLQRRLERIERKIEKATKRRGDVDVE